MDRVMRVAGGDQARPRHGHRPPLRQGGVHLVLFRERDGEVEVTDVLHEAMGVAGQMRG